MSCDRVATVSRARFWKKAVPACVVLLALAACSSERPTDTVLVKAEDGSWSVNIPGHWKRLVQPTLEQKPGGGSSVERGWLVEKYSESEKAVFLVWRGEGQDRIDPSMVPTKVEAQKDIGPGKEVLEIGRRDIGGRPFWRLVIQIHTEKDNRTTRQVLYRTWDEDGTYSFQFVAPPEHFARRLPLFESVAGSFRIEGPLARRKSALLMTVAIAAMLLTATVLAFLVWRAKRGR